jgi:hypothetical protein
VSPRGADLVVRDATFNGFPGGHCAPIVVSGTAAVRLIVEAPPSKAFRRTSA